MEDGGFPGGVQQNEFVGKSLALASDDGAVFFNFFGGVCDLDGSPGGDVPIVAGAKDAVQKPCYRAQSDVASMQRSHGTSFDLRPARGEDPGRLTIRRRFEQQVLDFVQRQSTVSELDRSAFWHGVAYVRGVGKNRKLLPLACDSSPRLSFAPWRGLHRTVDCIHGACVERRTARPACTSQLPASLADRLSCS